MLTLGKTVQNLYKKIMKFFSFNKMGLVKNSLLIFDPFSISEIKYKGRS